MTKLLNPLQSRATAIVLSLLLLGSGALYVKQAGAEEGETFDVSADSTSTKLLPMLTMEIKSSFV